MTPDEKKAREKEARDLASFLRTVIEAGGLESVGVASACVEKVASALDAAERRGFERAERMARDALDRAKKEEGVSENEPKCDCKCGPCLENNHRACKGVMRTETCEKRFHRRNP